LSQALTLYATLTDTNSSENESAEMSEFMVIAIGHTLGILFISGGGGGT